MPAQLQDSARLLAALSGGLEGWAKSFILVSPGQVPVCTMHYAIHERALLPWLADSGRKCWDE